MTTIDEALAMVLSEAPPKDTDRVDCSQAVGCVLAEDITADLDSPPHRKSLVDGYAVCATDTLAGEVCLAVIEEVFAGQVPARSLNRGEATRIMTGAPLPEGADAVAMVEDTEIEPQRGDEQEVVRIRKALSQHQNVQDRGSVMRTNDVILKSGHRIRPIEIGLLSEVGRTEVSVYQRPIVSILPTGDELVAPSKIPGPGQIRNTNGPMLEALALSSGATASSLGIGRDDVSKLRTTIENGLMNSDVLVLSGGVSMGRKDFVPGVLDELEVKKTFHRVQLRPGKPIWFGVWKNGDHQTLVFGLPGNPVSSFVCFHLFVRPAIAALQGARNQNRHGVVHLDNDFTLQGNRPTYFPARYIGSSDTIELLSWKGSADQRTLCDADCLAFFPTAGDYRQGQSIAALPLL